MRIDLEYQNLSDQRNALLFLPAFPTPKDMYINQIKLLIENQIPFIAVNYPGIDKSEKPNKIEMSISELTTIIWDNISKLPFKKLIPIGTSMGGYVMFEMWRQHSNEIASFVFCHTRPEALDEEGRRKRLSDIEKINENIEEYLKSFSRSLVSDYTFQNKPYVVDFINEITKKCSKEGLSSLVHVIATRPDSRDLLRKINIPCLLFAGKSDKIVPIETMQNMAKQIEDSTLIELENVGHMSALEVPEEFNHILLSFLEEKSLLR
ncbi:MAG: alpha/beta fold hydrolase [Brevinematia bacterium]